MSTLQVANIHFESTANNRVQYFGSNNIAVVVGGANSIATNTTVTTITGNTTINKSLTVSADNTTGGGIILSDDGDIVDLNDGYCSMRFSLGTRIYSGNKSGSAVITLGNDGSISLNGNMSFNSGYGSAAVAYGCRVWIRFITSLGAPSISNDGNVTSITDNGTGNFVINFTTALVDANYAAVANYSATNSAQGGSNDGQASCHSYAVGSVGVFTAAGDGSATDPQRCSLIVCR